MNYLVALEPAVELPSLEEAARRGTALTLEPGVPFETHSKQPLSGALSRCVL